MTNEVRAEEIEIDDPNSLMKLVNSSQLPSKLCTSDQDINQNVFIEMLYEILVLC